jgi:HSP20 family protein
MKTKEKDTAKALERHTTGFLEEMDRAFDTFMRRGWMRPLRDLWPESAFDTKMDFVLPRVDLIDRDNEVIVRAELPGIDKDHVHIDLAGSLLTIRGEREQKEEHEEGDFYRSEISRGSFVRTLQLPADVVVDEADASFDKGILEIRLPKAEDTKRRKIEVK